MTKLALSVFTLLIGTAAAFTSVSPAITTQLTTAVNRRTSALKPLFVASLDKDISQSSVQDDSPQGLIESLLNGWLTDPNTNYRMKVLLHSSTHKWRSKIYDAIGAPASADETKVADALANAMRNPNNQFAILLGMAEDYTMDFPSDAVEYPDNDNKCWIECRLYNKKDGALLVVSGWELQRNLLTGSWLIDRIDWQDFRDAFYPGLGREEWARAFV